MSELLSPLVYQIGAGGILGFLAGYAIKKVVKIAAVIAGLFALALIYFGYTGVINVNYEKLTEATEGLIGDLSGASQWISPIIANLPFAGSFLAGAALGLKKG
jgi:uncharacterized membrane protein (Fun14 family)